MGCLSLLDSISDFRLIAVVILWFVFGYLLLYSLKRKGFQKRYIYVIVQLSTTKLQDCHRLVMMSVAMIIVPFLPATNLFIKVGFVVAERVLYLPSSGWCLLFALGLSKMLVHHKTVRVNNV